MGHSADGKNNVLNTVKLIVVYILRLVGLVVCFALGVVGAICTKLSELIKHYVE